MSSGAGSTGGSPRWRSACPSPTAVQRRRPDRHPAAVGDDRDACCDATPDSDRQHARVRSVDPQRRRPAAPKRRAKSGSRSWSASSTPARSPPACRSAAASASEDQRRSSAAGRRSAGSEPPAREQAPASSPSDHTEEEHVREPHGVVRCRQRLAGRLERALAELIARQARRARLDGGGLPSIGMWSLLRSGCGSLRLVGPTRRLAIEGVERGHDPGRTGCRCTCAARPSPAPP